LKEYLYTIFKEAANKLNYLKDVNITFDVPKVESHGDLSSNAAMLLARQLKRKPREIAEEILASLKLDSNVVEKTEIAGAGFINFFFTVSYVSLITKDILLSVNNYGRSNKFSGKKANVEFVSANPTGPLTVGHGRNAVFGDTIANLLEWVGYSVDREYYFNNAGRQMRVLGDSVKLRYLELLGDKIEFPQDYYQGEYIKEIAKSLLDEYGDKLIKESAEGKFKEKAESEIFEDIKQSLKRLNIIHKIFFNENSLYEEGKIKETIDIFKEKGLAYEKEGATWLKLVELGNDQDKVIVKSTGEPTYRLPDIAYHVTKFKRGYDLMIDIFGSDHNATYPDVLAGLRALGYDSDKVKVLIHQFVTIMDGGEVVKMSTRKANYITLDQLEEEVGSDVVRYFFNMRNITTHMNFDLSLAKKQSDENPVFYLQYAHARICSILKMIEKESLEASTENLNLLTTNEELQLLKKLHQFKDEVLLSAEVFETHRICAYLEELAASFHKFYTFCRILGSEKKLAEARVALALATKIVLKNGLTILGVNAPERM
jgi:arginyl-tRNA synthetase